MRRFIQSRQAVRRSRIRQEVPTRPSAAAPDSLAPLVATVAEQAGQQRFQLQSYRRDLGGKFVAVKDVSVPIVVRGRHWDGLRLAYTT